MRGFGARWLVAFAGAFFILFWDPFSIKDAGDQVVSQFAARATAANYRETGAAVVILIDDESLARLGDSWPLPESRYADLVDRLTCYAPRAVFLDLFLTRSRAHAPGRERLLAIEDGTAPEVRCRGTATARPPLFYAVGTGKRPPLDGRVADDRRVSAVLSNDPGAYPMTGRAYAGGRWIERPTAAYRLAQHACARAPAACPPALPGIDAPELSLRWGSRVPDAQAAWSRTHGCRAPSLGLWGELKQAVPMFRGAEDYRWQPCPPVLTLSLWQIMQADGSHHEALQQALTGRTVFVGLGLDDSNDRVPSPVHGDLAGVMAHAVAFDNLIAWGDRYERRSTLQILVLKLVFLAAALAVAVAPRVAPSMPVRAALVWPALVLAVAAVGYPLTEWLRWPPSEQANAFLALAVCIAVALGLNDLLGAIFTRLQGGKVNEHA